MNQCISFTSLDPMQDGWTPLMTASSKNVVEAVRELLKGGADPNIISKVLSIIIFV